MDIQIDRPFQFRINPLDCIPSYYNQHLKRRLSSLKGQFLDQIAYASMLTEEDRLVYEVYAIERPEVTGELLHGVSIVHPGRVGEEYFMTKGHFHTVLETAEVYYVLKGNGYMVMEDPEGNWAVERLRAGRVLYVPTRWAQRSVNTGSADLATFFI